MPCMVKSQHAIVILSVENFVYWIWLLFIELCVSHAETFPKFSTSNFPFSLILIMIYAVILSGVTATVEVVGGRDRDRYCNIINDIPFSWYLLWHQAMINIGKIYSWKYFLILVITLFSFLPKASFGLWVLSLPASVCVCHSVCQSLAFPHDNLGPIQARITKFGPKLQYNLVKIPIPLLSDQPWPSAFKIKFNLKVQIYTILSFSTT